MAQVAAIKSKCNDLKRDGMLLLLQWCVLCVQACVQASEMANKAQTSLLKNEVLVKLKWGADPVFFPTLLFDLTRAANGPMLPNIDL